MAFEQIKGIVFDLDGTLIDSVPDLAAALNAVMEEFQMPSVDDTQVSHWVGNGMELLVTRALNHHVDKVDQELIERGFQLCAEAYSQVSGQHSVFFPGVRMVLKNLKMAGYRLAILTNKPSRFMPHIIEEFGLDDTFELVLGGDCLPKRKPDPMGLHHVCEQWQLEPSQVLMVGDSKNDIEAGKAAGTATLGLTYGYNYGEHIGLSQPDAVAEHMAELLELLAPAN